MSEVVDQVRKHHAAKEDQRYRYERVKEVVAVGIPESAGCIREDVDVVLEPHKINLSLHDFVV